MSMAMKKDFNRSAERTGRNTREFFQLKTLQDKTEKLNIAKGANRE